MRKIAVVGAGLIGRAWAVSFARGGFDVVLHDPDRTRIDEAFAFLDTVLPELERFGLVDSDAGEVRRRITHVATLDEAVAGADHVQENVSEDLELKRALFADLDRIAPPAAVLASSSSAIPASRFTAGLAGCGRCLVAHPVNPPYLVPLVELVPAPWTEPATLARTREIMLRAGQAPVALHGEIEGFVLNRLQGALLAEAFTLVGEGLIDVEDLDRVVRDGLGLRWAFMGPFETIDLNAPEGVRDYVARYGPAYARMRREGPPHREWDEELVTRIEAERRRRLPAERLEARARWRDRRLMALVAHRRRAERDIGS